MLFLDIILVSQRSCQICMPEHRLDCLDICTTADQMCCKGMTQGMRGDIHLNASLIAIIFDYFPKALSGHLPAATVCKQPD